MKTSILSTATVNDLADQLALNGFDVKKDKETIIVTELNGDEVLRGMIHSSGKNWLVRYDTTIIK